VRVAHAAASARPTRTARARPVATRPMASAGGARGAAAQRRRTERRGGGGSSARSRRRQRGDGGSDAASGGPSDAARTAAVGTAAVGQRRDAVEERAARARLSGHKNTYFVSGYLRRPIQKMKAYFL
jgi:hypothetical protein